jgi:hypothetical protein
MIAMYNDFCSYKCIMQIKLIYLNLTETKFKIKIKTIQQFFYYLRNI